MWAFKADVMAVEKGPNVANDQPEKRQQFTQQESELQQTVHQQTHSLARFFLEIDGNYKRFLIQGTISEGADDRRNAADH